MSLWETYTTKQSRKGWMYVYWIASLCSQRQFLEWGSLIRICLGNGKLYRADYQADIYSCQEIYSKMLKSALPDFIAPVENCQGSRWTALPSLTIVSLRDKWQASDFTPKFRPMERQLCPVNVAHSISIVGLTNTKFIYCRGSICIKIQLNPFDCYPMPNQPN